jgi:phosphatidylinositol phospholipase C, epsilon
MLFGKYSSSFSKTLKNSKNFFKNFSHTETQLIRCYPNARRFDSSNFSPIQFWSCGIQLVALNYQTIDSFQILNSAFFEQNRCCGYVLKPPVLWDKTNPDYGRMNPFEKKKDGEYISFYLRIVSGQYLTENNTSNVNANANGNTYGNYGPYSMNYNNLSYLNISSSASSNRDQCQQQINHFQHRTNGVEALQNTSTYVEVEIVGIPCDCTKEKTKIFSKNALNPVWNEEFLFHVVFPDLAFVRFSVIDNNNSHVILQRVIPLKCLRAGYRHIRMRSIQNQPLDIASIFIFSRQQTEFLSPNLISISPGGHNSGRGSMSNVVTSGGGAPNSPSLIDAPRILPKHKHFMVNIYGLSSPTDDESDRDNNGIQVKVTQETTVQQAIETALSILNKNSNYFKEKNYVLVQEVERRWSNAQNEQQNDVKLFLIQIIFN